MPKVSVVMGSISDWKTMKKACDMLDYFDISYEKNIISAHRLPDEMFKFAENAVERGIRVIIAGAGGAAHLPGMIASKTVLPVIGVPIKTGALNGIDSLYSIVQMPKGIPVATVAIGDAGAANAGILAAQILGAFNKDIQLKLLKYREDLKLQVLESRDELE